MCGRWRCRKRDQAEVLQQAGDDRRQRVQIMSDHDIGIVAPLAEHNLPGQRIALAFVSIVAIQIIFPCPENVVVS
jgi:hypothetical protein